MKANIYHFDGFTFARISEATAKELHSLGKRIYLTCVPKGNREQTYALMHNECVSTFENQTKRYKEFNGKKIEFLVKIL